MAFNPKEHIIQVSKKDYLPPAWRIVWFREVYPHGKIDTEFFALGDMVIAKTSVTNNEGVFLASGNATVRAANKGEVWTGRDIEKAETAAIGRALAHAGFGTQFSDEDDSDYLADSPQASKPAAAPKQDIDDIDGALGTNPPVLSDEQKFIINLIEIINPICKHENHARNAIMGAIEENAIAKGDSLDKAAGIMLLRRMKSQWGLTEDESRSLLPTALGMSMKDYLTANPRDYAGIWATLTARYAEMPE